MAVVFDLDGVLLDSEVLWNEARREVVVTHGGRWRENVVSALQGMSSVEWSAYLRDQLGTQLDEQHIIDLVVGNLLDRYRQHLPLLPGAGEAVARIGRSWPLGLASSANRPVIDEVLAMTGWDSAFRATVSSEEVPRGKPHPDVYLEAARRLGVPAASCAAIEDSANGIKAAAAAGMRIAAIPNSDFPPEAAALALADVVIKDLAHLAVPTLERLGERLVEPNVVDPLDEQEIESFPASDPHSDWAGPASP